jgi:fatty acid desaturase
VTDGIDASIFVLLVAGVIAAFIAGLWGCGWIWAALVLLVLMFAAMYARASSWFRDLRRAAGQPYETERRAAGRAARRREAGCAHASSRPMRSRLSATVGSS